MEFFRMRVVCVLLCCIAITINSGCSEPADQLKKPIALDKIPPEILKVAQDKYPNVEFNAAFTEVEAGQPVYELKGKTSTGKNYEVEVTKDGKILNP